MRLNELLEFIIEKKNRGCCGNHDGPNTWIKPGSYNLSTVIHVYKLGR